MNKEPISIRVAANGFVVFTNEGSHVAPVLPKSTHVFTDARALGDWVAQFYGAAPELVEATPTAPAHARGIG